MWEMDESKNARAKLDRYGHPVGKCVSYRKMLPLFVFLPFPPIPVAAAATEEDNM